MNLTETGFVRLHVAVLLFVLMVLTLPLRAEVLKFHPPNPQDEVIPHLSLYLKVQLDHKLKTSALNAGDVVQGTLARGVYSRDQQLFPPGSRVLLVVDTMEQRRRAPNDHWPWVIKIFTPRHEKFPAFRSAQVLLADKSEVCLQVSLLSIAQEVEVKAKKARAPRYLENSAMADSSPSSISSSSTKKGKSVSFSTAIFAASLLPDEESSVDREPGPIALRQSVTIAAGAQAKIILLGGISASRSRPGDSFQARLVEPLYVDHTLVLPEGSIFEGRVMRRKAPRMLSRSGSVLLAFTAVTTPGGSSAAISASVIGVELDRRSHTRVDPEGQLQGDPPGKAWMAMNLGVTGGVAKETDDAAQLLIEAIVSSATDVSTAGTARIAGACASSLFMLTRHGRDVVLPKFTEMDIMFDRPASLPANFLGQAVTEHPSR